MPRYIVTLTNDEIQELKALIQKGGKGYRIKHAQILLKLDQKPENEAWTYDRIEDAYGASRGMIAGIAKRFVMDGMEAALGRKTQENRRRKVTGDVEARICAIACSEPLAGRRETVMTETRTALDFAEILKYTSDILYPGVEKIVLVTDNLNTHSPASLYKAFAPEEARRLAERYEWHYTPKHGSWLDMAEIEIGIMSRQALGKPLPDLESFKKQVRSWTIKRNAENAKINWQFKTQDARIKLSKLYPSIV